MALNKMERDRVDILVAEGMAYDKAYDQVMNEAAVNKVKEIVTPKTPVEKVSMREKAKMLIQGKRYKSEKEFKPTGKRK